MNEISIAITRDHESTQVEIYLVDPALEIETVDVWGVTAYQDGLEIHDGYFEASHYASTLDLVAFAMETIQDRNILY
jgi:hypothetical protein